MREREEREEGSAFLRMERRVDSGSVPRKVRVNDLRRGKEGCDCLRGERKWV